MPSFSRGHFYFVTLSFAGGLPFAGAGAFDCLNYWNACKAALGSLIEQELIRGAFWVEEIKLLSLLPLRVMPHVHALVDADSFDRPALEATMQKAPGGASVGRGYSTVPPPQQKPSEGWYERNQGTWSNTPAN